MCSCSIGVGFRVWLFLVAWFLDERFMCVVAPQCPVWCCGFCMLSSRLRFCLRNFLTLRFCVLGFTLGCCCPIRFASFLKCFLCAFGVSRVSCFKSFIRNCCRSVLSWPTDRVLDSIVVLLNTVDLVLKLVGYPFYLVFLLNLTLSAHLTTSLFESSVIAFVVCCLSPCCPPRLMLRSRWRENVLFLRRNISDMSVSLWQRPFVCHNVLFLFVIRLVVSSIACFLYVAVLLLFPSFVALTLPSPSSAGSVAVATAVCLSPYCLIHNCCLVFGFLNQFRTFFRCPPANRVVTFDA